MSAHEYAEESQDSGQCPGLSAATTRGEFAALETGGLGQHPDPALGPPVLLLPGWTGSKEDYLSVLEPLATALPGSRIIAVDLRGQYETPGDDDPAAYALEALGLDVVALARSLDAGPVHLVGHSFGGLVARSAILEYPRLFRSLTLLCSGPAGITGPQADLLRLMAEAIAVNDLADVYAAKRALEDAARSDADLLRGGRGVPAPPLLRQPPGVAGADHPPTRRRTRPGRRTRRLPGADVGCVRRGRRRMGRSAYNARWPSDCRPYRQ